MLRIIEASIAVLFVLGVLIVVSLNIDKGGEVDIGKAIPGLLDEIARNSSLREEILLKGNGANESVKAFISDKIRVGVEYDVRICNPDELCSLDSLPDGVENVYSRERIISTNLEETNFSPKKIKIFLWRK